MVKKSNRTKPPQQSSHLYMKKVQTYLVSASLRNAAFQNLFLKSSTRHLLATALAIATVGSAQAVNTEQDVLTNKTDLTAAASYTPATTPTTTTDIAFTNGTYTTPTFTVGSALSIGTVNTLNTTQSLVITNNTTNTTLTLNGGGDTVSGSSSSDLIYLAANSNLTIQTGSKTLGLALASGISGNFDVAAGSTLTISSIVSGAFATSGTAFQKTGAGTLTLSGNNSFGGGGGRKFGLTAGTLNINSNTALGNNQTIFVIAAGTTIDNTSGSSKTVNGNQQTWNGNFTYTGTNDLNLGTGSVTLGTTAGTVRTITTAAGTLTTGGVVANGTTATGITKAGNGTWILSGANTFTGGTTLSAGTLVAGVSSVLSTSGAFGVTNGTSSGAIALGDAATTTNNSSPTLLINGAFSVANPITVANRTTTGIYTIGGSNASGTASYTGNITLNKPVTLVAATGGTVDFNTGTWSTGNNAIQVGSAGNTGTVKLSSNLSTTGGVSVNYGTLAANSNLGSTPVSVASGTTLSGSGTVGAITGAGTVAPGNSPGILTASSATLGALGESFKFELTSTSINYATANNDILHLTSGTTPLSGTATGANIFDIYFSTAALAASTAFQGGIFTDKSTSFLSSVSSGAFNYYVLGDGSGTHAYNGTNYYTLTEYDTLVGTPFDITLSTIQVGSAAFATGTVSNGYVMQFDVATVPEPGTWAMLIGGFGLLILIQHRRSKLS